MMAKAGRPRGTNNKDYNYTIRLDEYTRNRLEAYCLMINASKSDVIRRAIEKITEEINYEGREMTQNE